MSDEITDPAVLDAAVAAFDTAVAGTAQVIPAYTVSTDPGDGSFVVIWADTDLDVIGRNLVTGDLRRRFQRWAATDVDPFTDIRVPWPGQL